MAKDEAGPKTGRPGYTEPGRLGVSRFCRFLTRRLAASRACFNSALQGLYIEGSTARAAAALGAASLPFGREDQPHAPAQVEERGGKKGDDDEQLSVHDGRKTRRRVRKFTGQPAAGRGLRLILLFPVLLQHVLHLVVHEAVGSQRFTAKNGVTILQPLRDTAPSLAH